MNDPKTPDQPIDAQTAALIDRIAKGDHAQVEDQNELIRQVLLGGAKIGGLVANVGSGIAAVLDYGVASGSFALVASACAAAEMAILKMATSRMEKNKKKPDWSGRGYGLALECARNGAKADDVLREQWVRLLMACLDPDSKGTVRRSDIELLQTFNPPEALLVLVMGTYRAEMVKDWQDGDVWKWVSRNGNVRQCTAAFPLPLVFNWTRLLFNQPAVISMEEMIYAHRARLMHSEFSEGAPPLFAPNAKGIENWEPYLQGAPPAVMDHPHAKMVSYMIDSTLVPRAQRLVSMLVDPKKGY